ncbi:DUF4032 domain-containing protein [Modestobacter sp. I12A-02628]|uniref:DUF4032 domain-containing protein n=1 Tax=Goekera deserti TaxID=2497753 RepID=A0A7K3WHL0_9ACTN|nr:DUF4032 domain-containing protein [Goekera deserti]MPQ97971.1 DUF4032 domain-containing protein [Goekera deserti]NDI48618.1 DUF4032 domain-containing protein [Goekera deserti]NEL55003.1 DUF4032 domain-containing protein [Goekera deserti]
MRYLFRPPADAATGLLTLPWHQPLADWDDDRLVEVPQRGLSRHVVRFVAVEGRVYALKELPEPLARREYTLLGRFEADGLPAVRVLGICVDRPGGQEAVLVTRYLEYSTSYRHLFSTPRTERSAHQLVDTLVVLLVRLHLAGVFWGDCSLSNTLFRPDAGSVAAHLVDAETTERHARLSTGQRDLDLDIAADRVGAELLDLLAAGVLPDDVDPVETARSIRPRYEALWDELGREELVGRGEQFRGVADRLARLDALGFDAGEVELVSDGDGYRVRVETRVREPGQHRRELSRLTGLDVSENQARRLLDDLRSHRAQLEGAAGVPVAETVAAHRWVAEEYLPVVEAVPAHLAGRLAPAELFHEILEHRWFLSEQAGRDVGTAAAATSYLETVLPRTSAAVPQLATG